MKKLFVLFAFLIFNTVLLAQICSPTVANSAGGYSGLLDNKYYLDWSVGEQTVVETVTKNTFLITHGVIQPELPNPSTNDFWGPLELRVYPNPFVNQLILSFASYNVGVVRVNIYNVIGQLVFTHSFYYPGGIYEHKLNLVGLPAGSYIIIVGIPEPTLGDPRSIQKDKPPFQAHIIKLN